MALFGTRWTTIKDEYLPRDAHGNPRHNVPRKPPPPEAGWSCGCWGQCSRMFPGGRRCQKVAMPSLTRCAEHTHINNSTTVGRYSARLHSRELRDRFERALVDPQILDSKQEVALSQTLLATLLGNAGADPEALERATPELIKHLDLITRQQERAQRIEIERAGVLTAEDARVLVVALADGVNRLVGNVHERQALKELFMTVFGRLLTGDVAQLRSGEVIEAEADVVA